MGSRLQYPSLDERSFMHYFCLSNITSKYIFSSREPDMIVPLNWHMNLAKNCKSDKSLSKKAQYTLPLSIVSYDDTPECISDAEIMATLEDFAMYQLQCSLNIITDEDEEMLYDNDYYEEDYDYDD